jgi:hypothetical protein
MRRVLHIAILHNVPSMLKAGVILGLVVAGGTALFASAIAWKDFRSSKGLLKNWDGDTRQMQYEQIAVQMAKSIRVHDY